jgi:hypothetical protein
VDQFGIFEEFPNATRLRDKRINLATWGLNEDFIIFLSFTMTPAWRTFLFIPEDFITIQNHGQQLAQEG